MNNKKLIIFMPSIEGGGVEKNLFLIANYIASRIKNIGLLTASRGFDHKFKNLEIIKSCDVGLSSVILKKNLLSKITKFPNLKTKEDFVLWLKITRKGINIDPLDVNLVQWRNVHNSLSSSILRKLLDGYTVYRKFLNFGRLKSFFYLIILSLNYVKKSK